MSLKQGKIIEKFFCDTSSDEAKQRIMNLINQYTRKELCWDDVYVFPITLCDNEIDRDTERFTVESLNRLSDLFKGKTVITDHEWKSDNQVARIFELSVERVDGRRTKAGDDLYRLNALAYMVRNPKSEPLISEIDAGIKKEVSVGCACGKATCSICGEDFYFGEKCFHRKGEVYDGKTCFVELENPMDAYEVSFVAIPAQKEAGVQKQYDKNKEEKEKMFKYSESLKEYGIDEETFKKFDLESEKVEEVAKFVKGEQGKEYISKSDVKEALGEEKSPEEVLKLAKEAKQNKADAEKYVKLFNATVEDALKEGVKAKGESFDSERWKKILNSFSVEEVRGQAEEWHGEAEKQFNAGGRVSEPGIGSSFDGRKLSEKDINF